MEAAEAMPSKIMKTTKGMVQVAGTTYRIVRLGGRRYEVVRILDEAWVGAFSLDSRLEVTEGGLAATSVRDIATAAIRGAKISWGRMLELS